MSESYRCSQCKVVWTRDQLEEYAYDHEDGRMYLCPSCDTDINLADDEVRESS